MPKNKIKLNDKIDKKKKNKKLKPEKYISEEAKEVRKFAIILISVIVFILVIYGISRIFIKEQKEEVDNQVTAGEINYDIVSVGTMLNRNENEYYVIIYDQEDSQAVIYSSIISKYSSKEDSLRVFYCNLGNKLNKDYYVGKDGESNPKAKSISELALRNLTLIKVKDNKIIKYLEDVDTIKAELGI